MPRRSTNLLAAAPFLAFVGIVSASLQQTDPNSRLAVPVLAVIGSLLTAFIARRHKEPEVAEFLLGLMLLGVAARLLVFTFVQGSVGPYVFAPDQVTYERWGREFLWYMQGHGHLPPQLANSFQIGFPAINAFVFWIFGPALFGPVIVNMFLSCWTVVPLYHLVRLLVPQSPAIARIAAGLAAFFPSLVLWSTLNIREAPTIFLVVSVVYFLVRVQKAPDLTGLSGAAVSVALLSLFREYLMVLVGVSGGVGVLMGKSRSPLRSVLVGSTLLIVLTMGVQYLGVGQSLAEEPSLEAAQMIRADFQRGAGSAYGQGADVSSLPGAVAYLPLGLAYFLLAPFPWAVASALQTVALPETLLWWAVVPFGLWGAWLSFRHDARGHTVPITILLVVTFAYALVEANVGTAFRHRGQVLPIMLLYVAIGIRDVWAIQEARRRSRDRGRSRATSGWRARAPASDRPGA